MTRFLLERLGRLIAVLVFASLLVFSAVYLAPGSAVATLSGGRSLTPEQVAQLKAQYHLDQPLITQYWTWLTGVLRGDLGRSLISQESVTSLIAARLGTTVLLVGYASILIVSVGMTLGTVAALRGHRTDTVIVTLTGTAAAVPSFVAAAALVGLFAVRLGWFPVFGDGSGLGVASQVWHLTLPAIALALAAMGFTARVTRTSILNEQGQDHVRIATGLGLPRARIIRRHILRNSLIPITTAVGITIASLIAGSVVVEQAFALNGLGSLLVQAISAHDYAVVQSVTLLLVAAFIVVNTIVDLVHPLLDPRLQVGEEQ